MKSILLIEDDRMVAELVTMILADAGYRVEWVPTVREGSRRLIDGKPSLVLLDLTLPDGDGASLIEQCKADGMLAHIPIVAMSGTSPALLEGRRGARPDAIVPKPFDIDELCAVVDRLTGGGVVTALDGNG